MKLKIAKTEWWAVSQKIHTTLKEAAHIAHLNGKISEEDRNTFYTSVTEKEIIKGILSAEDANERTLCFIREVTDIHQNLTDKKASDYINMINNFQDVDIDAEKSLKRLINDQIPLALNASNIIRSSPIKWAAGGITRLSHSDYIKEFDEQFFSVVQKQIDACLRKRRDITDRLYSEVLAHAIRCKNIVDKFHGRGDILAKTALSTSLGATGREKLPAGGVPVGKKLEQ
ncbi:unnamed protein product [Didymodactylos carnosus]|uniref:Uncharacterized protein n=1 Tax=Didymodactylos carnosus TaxID=1234261 RepID=A0A815NPM6_9BILA|nr:unnamed protein product [Didymodactylos carnosus]CAF4314000.1 unnamed protein product [Didymodactylos carnosus]